MKDKHHFIKLTGGPLSFGLTPQICDRFWTIH